MSNLNLDSVAATLQNLRDIVNKNHSTAIESSRLLQDMEQVLEDIRAKTAAQITISPVAETGYLPYSNNTAIPAL